MEGLVFTIERKVFTTGLKVCSASSKSVNLISYISYLFAKFAGQRQPYETKYT